MKLQTYSCDGCKTQRKESNHWYLGFLFKDAATAIGIQVTSWNTESINGVSVNINRADAHLCGAACVSRWVSENLLS